MPFLQQKRIREISRPDTGNSLKRSRDSEDPFRDENGSKDASTWQLKSAPELNPKRQKNEKLVDLTFEDAEEILSSASSDVNQLKSSEIVNKFKSTEMVGEVGEKKNEMTKNKINGIREEDEGKNRSENGENEQEDEENKVEDQEQENQEIENKEEEEEDDSEEEPVPEDVKYEMLTLIEMFPSLPEKYKLLDKIGEGTFSSVYKAEDLTGASKAILGNSLWNSPSPKKGKKAHKKNPVVALKRIYVTSSPQRIFNELQLLYSLSGCSNVAPLIDALRYEDQVIAVLPFYRHADFRDFYRDLPLEGIKFYMFELFKGLSFIHSKKILHRDIKPTNFLYDPFKKKGVLVDFGLAERQEILDSKLCPCIIGGLKPEEIKSENILTNAFLKDDPRPGKRANRAGTRGFRAPEVLLKCSNQTTKIDMWSAGVMLLTILTRRFPFFNSPDDPDALVELTSVFGTKNMKKCARLHGLGLESTIIAPPHQMGELVHWAISLEEQAGTTLATDSPALESLEALHPNGEIRDMNTKSGLDHFNALELLDKCLCLDPKRRISADQALKSGFFDSLRPDVDEVVVD